MEIIDNFYNKEQLENINNIIESSTFNKTHQPVEAIDKREDAYPCYETEILKPNNYIFKNFVNCFNQHKNVAVKKLKTYIRKTYLSELKECKVYKQGLKSHRDRNCDAAGIVYLNTNNINDGTVIYEGDNPSVIIGSKINRCIAYKSNVWHSPNLKQTSEVRIIQPFFLYDD